MRVRSFGVAASYNCGTLLEIGDVVFPAAIGGMSGVALGAIVGSFVKVEEWRTVAAEEVRLRAGLAIRVP